MAQTPNAEICAALAKTEIPAGSIGLPTTGASILTAAMVAANEPNNPNGDYCKVTGAIRPVDPKAPNILFQVNLPAKWNGKAVHMGGGGFNGTVVTGQGAVSMGLAGVPPLSQGYATFGSDSGHQDPTGGPSFAANDEALLNYGALHLKKTLDVATDIIARHYGKRPARMYFAGASTGGREGLTVAQRWPATPLQCSLPLVGQAYDGGLMVVGRGVHDGRNGIRPSALADEGRANAWAWQLEHDRDAGDDCPLAWVARQWDRTDPHENPRRQAFWRVLHGVAHGLRLGDADDWSSHLACSALHKVTAPPGWPQPARLREAQQAGAARLLALEHRLLRPRRLLLLTGWDWAEPFLGDRKSTRLNSSHVALSRMPSSA